MKAARQKMECPNRGRRYDFMVGFGWIETCDGWVGRIQYVDARSTQTEFVVNLSRSGSLEMRMRFVYSSMDLDGDKRIPDRTLEASAKRIVARFLGHDLRRGLNENGRSSCRRDLRDD
ncbi:hypothetical protein KFK09_024406 [Dendrobium nobile]|uniref:Uncharacterized protein n=1 Tax=Dendrobium nobile TaxID=94219 RepID=A0A8T3AE00_DENNO|nr:hypothetical protein KFK09_024406 [Dendrobium nobile]